MMNDIESGTSTSSNSSSIPSSREKVEDSNGANVDDEINPCEYGPFPDFEGTNFEIFGKKKEFLEQKLAIQKPDVVKGIALFFAIAELSLAMFNILLYYWLKHVHAKLYTDMKVVAVNKTFENFDSWTDQNVGHSVMFSVAFTFVLPQAILVPLMLDTCHPLFKTCSKTVLFGISALAGFVAIAWYIPSSTSDKIHGSFGYTACTAFIFVILHRTLLQVSKVLISLKHMDRILAFLKLQILKEVILTYSIATTFVAITTGFQEYMWKSIEEINRIYSSVGFNEKQIMELRWSEIRLVEVAFGSFVVGMTFLIVSMMSARHIKENVGGVTRNDFRIHFLQFENYPPQEATDSNTDPLAEAFKLYVQPIRAAY